MLCDCPGKKVWQKDYIASIIQIENHFLNIKEYIKNNPAKWTEHD